MKIGNTDGIPCSTATAGALVDGTGKFNVENTCRVIGNGSVLQKKPENSRRQIQHQRRRVRQRRTKFTVIVNTPDKHASQLFTFRVLSLYKNE